MKILPVPATAKSLGKLKNASSAGPVGPGTLPAKVSMVQLPPTWP